LQFGNEGKGVKATQKGSLHQKIRKNPNLFAAAVHDERKSLGKKKKGEALYVGDREPQRENHQNLLLKKGAVNGRS